jgi:pimeloyl-ACP methyl ester carboxylesterase
MRTLPAQTSWSPAPEQAPVTERIAALPGGARLWYWDTGGDGDVIVLVHAASGSGAFWEYQQPVLARAGYRVIGYSTRGHYRSDPSPQGNPGTGSGDLHELVDYLKLGRFHLVGTAAGAGLCLDYAVSHADRLLSLTYANSLGGIQDEAYGNVLKALLPANFHQLPVDFRELGPSYRAGYRAGVERWMSLHEQSSFAGQPYANKLTWAGLQALRVPMLLLTGDADPYMPPSTLRDFFVRHLPHAEAAILSESGHSGFWEQPQAFNAELLRFLQKHRQQRS